ncbi:MAG: Rne/Rng family ribonuclease [Gammaproteobacteria bacterium]|nr:MAG: Rne/Rng family ribonuclease [Gammaproteobacteria bacterium]
MKRMLINATQEEELRVAMVDGQKLYDLDIESPSREQRKANIYKGRISRIEPSLDAAFVDYGADRHGFLPMKEISREYFVAEPEAGGRMNIRELLREGQEIVVQVDKDERGTKGAALTTFISLAGRFIVLMPNNPRGGGVSRRISGEERDEIREAMHDLEVPRGMGVIIRTAGVGRSVEELNWDMSYLLGIWDAIKKAVVSRPAPFLIFQDSNAIVRALRDHLANDVGEIVIDDVKTFEEARQFMERAMPQNLRKLRQYEDPVPLFTRFQIESQIESAFSHLVTLPSGGSLVIEQTEALVSIDINSARATKGEDIEATALATNLEAADEVARQCRLRDLGGLLVVDFIDMTSQRGQRDVENRLRDAMRMDRARVQIGRISRFGLLELSRQRLRPSLGESAHQTCPRCNGAGHIRGVESMALAILRLIGEEARKERSARVIAQLPVDVATYLLNEKRDWIRAIEQRDHVELILIANPSLETPNYVLRRVRDDQVSAPENVGASYTMAAQEQPPSDAALDLFAPRIKSEEPAVVPPMPATPAPLPAAEPVEATATAVAAPARPGLVARFFSWLSGSATASETRDEERRPQAQPRQGYQGNRPRGQHGRPRRDDRSRGPRGGQGGDSRDYRQQSDQRGQRNGRPGSGSESGRSPDRPGQRADGRRGDHRGEQGRGGEQGSRQHPAQGGEARGGQQPVTEGGAQAGPQQGQGGRRDRPRSRRRGGRGRGGDDRARGGDDRAPREQTGGAPDAPVTSVEPRRFDGPHSADHAVERGPPPIAAPLRESASTTESRPPPEAASAAPVERPAPAPVAAPDHAPAWEPPAPREPNTAKTYTVWSSTPADDPRDRGSSH